MKQKKDIIIVGFALFSVFFGASNLIFPPFIGVTSGSEWLTSFLGFVLGDVGIILLSIYAIAKCGDYQSIVGRAGKNFGLSLEIMMMLCLGPILAIPRTAAINSRSKLSLFLNYLLCLNPYINDSSNKSNGYYREVPNSCFINLSSFLDWKRNYISTWNIK